MLVRARLLTHNAVARPVAVRAFCAKSPATGERTLPFWDDFSGRKIKVAETATDLTPVEPTGELDASFIGKKQLYLAPGKKTPAELIAEVPPVEVEKRVVGCNGGGGALGHPVVYFNLDSGKPVSCNYCGVRYVMKDTHHH